MYRIFHDEVDCCLRDLIVILELASITLLSHIELAFCLSLVSNYLIQKAFFIILFIHWKIFLSVEKIYHLIIVALS